MVIFCKECGKQLLKGWHFERNNDNTYYYCDKCYYRTKPKKINYEEIPNIPEEEPVKTRRIFKNVFKK